MDPAVIVGPLGALAGAAVGAIINSRASRRAEQARIAREAEAYTRELRGAARLVMAEIHLIGEAASAVVKAARPTAAVPSVARHRTAEQWAELRTAPTTAWNTHGALLAAQMDPESVGAVAAVYARLRMTGRVGEHGLISVYRGQAERLLAACLPAVHALQGMAEIQLSDLARDLRGG